MKLYQMSDPVRFPRMTTDELRRTFPLEDLFVPDSVTWAYVDLDRAVIGGVIPRRETLRLGNYPELRAELFLERRELGVLNIGGPGSVMADGKTFDMEKLDCVYIGRGTREVSFTSKDASTPAVFYLLSYPAHAAFPAAQKRFVDLESVELGSLETCKRRMLYKAIYQGCLPSSQLVLGFTLLQPGSNWNTMSPHTHMRRSEVYLYFDVPRDHRVVHLTGPPGETRHLMVADRQVVVSPGWSIHAGVGTTSHGFCWGMGGEN